MSKHKLALCPLHGIATRAKRTIQQCHTAWVRFVRVRLRQLDVENDFLADAPIVRRLSGILSSEASVDDYTSHLEEKYGTTTTTKTS